MSATDGLYRRGGKRLLDLVAVLLGLVVAGPVMVVVALVLLVAQGRPVLFRQRRPGLHGAVFEILKFRTMRDASDGDGHQLPDEQRLTGVGRFLRRTSLDELPELLNVLRGDMSLVGPRPLLVRYLERYSAEQSRRHDVRPGVTGWAQVNGRNALTWEEKFRLDVWYADNASFLLDVRILLLTVWKVIRGEGVSADGFATMPEFMGSGGGPGDGREERR